MIQLSKFHKMLFMALVATLALIYYMHWVYLPKQYEDFVENEREVIYLFDQLNANVANELPSLPPNSSIQMQETIGLGDQGVGMYLHGRILQIDISTKQPANFVVKYYNDALLKQGWSKDTNKYYAVDFAIFYKGTSCIKIDATSHIQPDYEILIWHDYKKQKFTPKIPNNLDRFEYGKTSFETCP